MRFVLFLVMVVIILFLIFAPVESEAVSDNLYFSTPSPAPVDNGMMPTHGLIRARSWYEYVPISMAEQQSLFVNSANCEHCMIVSDKATFNVRSDTDSSGDRVVWVSDVNNFMKLANSKRNRSGVDYDWI
jgi:hypothetical protein